MTQKKNKTTVLELQKIIDKINLKQAHLPRGIISLHDFYDNHGEEATMDFLRFSNEEDEEKTEIPYLPISDDPFEDEREDFNNKGVEDTWGKREFSAGYHLKQINAQRLRMETQLYNYDVLGHLDQDHSSLRITLLIEELTTGVKERTKIDLYERMARHSLVLQLSEIFDTDPQEAEFHLAELTGLLENHREASKMPSNSLKNNAPPSMSVSETKEAIDILQSPNLIKGINDTLEDCGIVGEEAARLLLFIAASTYKTENPLHVLVQGTSGSGKSHLLNTIGYCIPEEDVISMTRVTSKSFYHYKEDELVNKLMLIQDFDGLDEEAQYAFRELQTAKEISSSTTYKNSHGELMSKIKKVKSQFASILATTKADVYYDNMSRCIVIGVNESEDQTIKIIEHQNRQLAGLVDYNQITQSQRKLKNIIRCLKQHEVVNPYAHLIRLPMEAKMQRRLNGQFQAFIRQITLFHQHQRDKDEHGRLITTVEDIKLAVDILFEAIMLKVDELDSSLRQFFDCLKQFIKEKSKGQTNQSGYETFEFYQRDVRQALNISKSSCFRYMEDLLNLEYISRTGGYSNRGYRYRVEFWDDMQKVKTEIKEKLQTQIEKLGHEEPQRTANGTPVNHQTSQKQEESGLVVQSTTSTHLKGTDQNEIKQEKKAS